MLDWIKRKKSNVQSFGAKITSVDEIKQHSNEIVNLANKLMSPRAAIRNARIETFEGAQKRLGVSLLDIQAIRRNYVISFYISMGFAVFCFIGFLYYAFFEQRLITTLAMTAIMLLCFSNAFRFSFRAFQIKKQELCAVREWWDSPQEWLPK